MRALRPAIVLTLFSLDRVTKYWAIHVLQAHGPIKIFPFFDLLYVENTGAAFSLGRGANGFFIILSTGLISYLLWMMRSWKVEQRLLQWGGLFVLSGALGNLYDRISYRYVVDFLYLHYWPVFNVADSCICIGAGLIAISLNNKK